MGHYTKKPVTIEARRFETNNDDGSHIAGLVDWANADGLPHATHDGTWIMVSTHQGDVHAEVGDWLIRGLDGEIYPCKDSVFQATYAAAKELAGSGMSFGDAISALKAGLRVCRSGWNGKSMWLALTPGSTVPATAAARSGALLAYVQAESVAEVRILPHIDMRAADGSLVIGWLASQTDMLADDWMIVVGDTVRAA